MLNKWFDWGNTEGPAAIKDSASEERSTRPHVSGSRSSTRPSTFSDRLHKSGWWFSTRPSPITGRPHVSEPRSSTRPSRFLDRLHKSGWWFSTLTDCRLDSGWRVFDGPSGFASWPVGLGMSSSAYFLWHLNRESRIGKSSGSFRLLFDTSRTKKTGGKKRHGENMAANF